MSSSLNVEEQENQRKVVQYYRHKLCKKYFAILQQQTLDQIRSRYLRAYAFEQTKNKIKVLNGFMLDSIRFQQLNNQAICRYCKSMYRKYFDLLKSCQINKLGNTINNFSRDGQNSSGKKQTENYNKRAFKNNDLMKQFYEETNQVEQDRQINKVLFPPLPNKRQEHHRRQEQIFGKNMQFDWQRQQRKQQFQSKRANRTASQSYFQNQKSYLSHQKEGHPLSYTRQKFTVGNNPQALSDSRRSVMTAMSPGASVNMPRRKYTPITQIPSLPTTIPIPQEKYKDDRQSRENRENKTEDLLFQSKRQEFKNPNIQQELKRKKNIIEAVINFKAYELQILESQIFRKDQQVTKYAEQSRKYLQKLKSY